MAAQIFPDHEYNRNRWILAKADLETVAQDKIRRYKIMGRKAPEPVKISSAHAEMTCRTPRTQDEGHIRPIILRDTAEPDADMVNAIRRLFHPTEVYF